MTNPAGNPMDAVATLMLERQRYEAWLAQLESRRAITPPHVFERVRADYERRLREVTEQLTSRTSEVQATMGALTERLARLQTDETALRDERYEAELRSHVGEMTATEWDRLQRDTDERIGRIGAERTTVTGEIARLQQLLAMSRDRATGTGDAAAQRDGEKGAGRAKGGPGFDELEFLKSVTDGSRASGGSASTPPPRVPTPAAADAVRSSGAAPAPRSPTPASAPAAAPMSPPPAAIPGFGGSGAGDSRNDPKPAEPAKEPDQVPSFLRDVPQEATKTLKCGACGAMNFPTEWYCERCGAELAGM